MTLEKRKRFRKYSELFRGGKDVMRSIFSAKITYYFTQRQDSYLIFTSNSSQRTSKSSYIDQASLIEAESHGFPSDNT